MKELILLPQRKTFICSADHNLPKNNLYAGADSRGCRYRTLLRFDPGLLPNDCRHVSATLKAFAVTLNRDMTGRFAPCPVINAWDRDTRWDAQPGTEERFAGNAVEIDRSGWYVWDVSAAADAWAEGTLENHGLMMRAPEEDAGLVCFETVLGGGDRQSFSPVLTVRYGGEQAPDGQKKTDSEFEILGTGKETTCSIWRDTSRYKTSTFLICNEGPDEARVHVQISPNKSVFVQEAAVYRVSACETSAIVPQRYAFFTRLAVRSTGEGGSKLNIWFQAQE